MIGCVVVSDRGDLYLPDTMTALYETLPTTIPIRVIEDRDHLLGLAGAAAAAWALALDAHWDALLHWEEDFRPVDLVPLDDMQDLLARRTYLSQVVLKRQAWNTEEIAAGGLVESHPSDYREVRPYHARYSYLEHRRIFSLNPCLIPRWVLSFGWPAGNEAEMTATLNEDPQQSFAIFGGRHEPPRVQHVGAVRGTGWRE